MKEFKQSRYYFLCYTVACVVLSFLISLTVFNCFTLEVSKITATEVVCSLLSSIGIDILFVMWFKNKFDKDTVKLDDEKISIGEKVIYYKDILDVNIDPTLCKSVKKVYIDTATEQIILVLGSYGFTTLFETMPQINVSTEESVDDIKIDRRSALDTLSNGLANVVLYLTSIMLVVIFVVLTFRQRNGETVISDINREYVWYSALIFWVVFVSAYILYYLLLRLRFGKYQARFGENELVIVYGRSIINNRVIKKSNVHGVLVKQNIVNRLVGRYRVKLLTDSIGGNSNEFEYFPYLLNEEQKNAIVKYFIGIDEDDIKYRRSNRKAFLKAIICGGVYTVLSIFISIFYSWTFIVTILPIWIIVLYTIINKKTCLSIKDTSVISYGFISKTLYFKDEVVESIEYERDIFDSIMKTYSLTLYFNGYKEQKYIGCIDKRTCDEIVAKLKK